MRSLHLRRRTAALLLVPVLLVAGVLTDEPRSSAVDPDRTATIGRSALGVPGTGVPAAQPGEPVPPASAGGRSRDRAGEPADRQPRASLPDRGRAALASLRYDWRALGYRVDFRPYDGRGLGSANRRLRVITVYVRPGQSDLSLRVSLAHELGHALDFEHGTTARRDSYRRIRGLPSTGSWFPCDRCDDYASPAGDFAEVFAVWLVGPGDFRSRLQGPPDPRQLRELGALFELPRSGVDAAAVPSAAPSPEPTDEEAEQEEEPEGLTSVLDPVASPPPGV